MTTTEILRPIILVIASAAIGVWTIRAAQNKYVRVYAIIPLAWLLNEWAFWFMRSFFVDSLAVEFINGWSLVLHLQSLIMVLLIPIVFMHRSHTEQHYVGS
jgi:hypothetical protein